LRAAVLPASLHLEGLGIEDREAAGTGTVAIAEHAHHDVVAWHAVHGVGTRVARSLGELLRFDDALDLRPARVAADTQHVDPRRAEPGDDQVRAVGAVAGRAAAVPAEVMELVPEVRHRGLVDDFPE
jgi:hypothetical protein